MQPILTLKNNWGRGSVSPFVKLFREELNWMFAKYKRLEKNPLYIQHVILIAIQTVIAKRMFLYIQIPWTSQPYKCPH